MNLSIVVNRRRLRLSSDRWQIFSPFRLKFLAVLVDFVPRCSSSEFNNNLIVHSLPEVDVQMRYLSTLSQHQPTSPSQLPTEDPLKNATLNSLLSQIP